MNATLFIVVSRSARRPYADLYLFNLVDAIPCFSLPLKTEAQLPIINLNTLLGCVYERAGYDFVIDYSGDPVPPVAETEAVWLDPY